MQCQMCNTENEPAAQYCSKCGSALIVGKSKLDDGGNMKKPATVSITEETQVQDPREHFRQSSMTLTKKVTITSEGQSTSGDFYNSMEKLLKGMKELNPEEKEVRKNYYYLMLFTVIFGLAALVCIMAIMKQNGLL